MYKAESLIKPNKTRFLHLPVFQQKCMITKIAGKIDAL